jgi:PKD repeat protein
VQFTDLSTNTPTTWAWDFENDGTVDSTEQNPQFSYPTAGTYTVKLTAGNAGGNDDEIKTDYITVTVAPPTDLIFANGFEAGNLSAWSLNSVTDGGDLSVTSAAAMAGAFGLHALLDDNNPIYVIDDSPNPTETRYRARFYFDPNSLPMANGDAHYIFQGLTGTTVVVRIEFRRNQGNYQVRAAAALDGSGFTSTAWFTISDASHFIEIDWRAATAVGANNGGLTLWVDGAQLANLTGIDNDTRRVDLVRLGAVGGVDSGTRGTYYFDAFESRRQSYIGPDPTVPPPPADIFADSFVSGNLSAWSASTTDGGDLSVTSAAAMDGDASGMQAVLDNNTSIYVTDNTPNAETRYLAGFYFDPNSIPMSNGNAHYILQGLMGTSTVVVRIEFRRNQNNYQVRAAAALDGSGFTNTAWFTITDAPHFIAIDWQAATAIGANNGSLTLWVDDVQQANVTGIDNDTRRIDSVRLGAVASIDSGTRGTYYFDAFESFRQPSQ